MGLTGFNRQRRQALTDAIGDPALADKLMAYGYGTPERVEQASEEDLSFLTDEELATIRGEEAEAFQDLTVEAIKDKVAETDDLDLLAEWLEVEANNKDRKTAKAAIKGRIEELAAPEEEPEEEEAEADQASEEGAETEPEEEESPEADEKLPEYPFHKGGGVYQLSNGDTVRGEKAAHQAEQALNEG